MECVPAFLVLTANRSECADDTAAFLAALQAASNATSGYASVSLVELFEGLLHPSCPILSALRIVLTR